MQSRLKQKIAKPQKTFSKTFGTQPISKISFQRINNHKFIINNQNTQFSKRQFTSFNSKLTKQPLFTRSTFSPIRSFEKSFSTNNFIKNNNNNNNIIIKNNVKSNLTYMPIKTYFRSPQIKSNLVIAPSLETPQQIRLGHGARRVYPQGKRKREINKRMERYSYEDKDLKEARLMHERSMFEKKLYVLKHMVEDVQRHSGGKKAVPIVEVMSYLLTTVEEQWGEAIQKRSTQIPDLNWLQRREAVAATGGSNVQVRICWFEIIRAHQQGTLLQKIEENKVRLQRIQVEDEVINQIRDKKERLQRQRERESERMEELRAKGTFEPLLQEMYKRYVKMIEMKQSEIDQLQNEEDRLTGQGKFEIDEKDMDWVLRGDSENFEKFLETEDEAYTKHEEELSNNPDEKFYNYTSEQQQQENIKFLEEKLREVMKEKADENEEQK